MQTLALPLLRGSSPSRTAPQLLRGAPRRSVSPRAAYQRVSRNFRGGAGEESMLPTAAALLSSSSFEEQTARVAQLLALAESDASRRAAQASRLLVLASESSDRMQEAAELDEQRARQFNALALDENQARAEAMMRGFADVDASGVISRFLNAALEASAGVAGTATGQTVVRARTATIIHSVAANNRKAVTVTVPSWQPSASDAFAKLSDGITGADALAQQGVPAEGRRGA